MSCKSLLYMVGMFVFVPVWIGLLWTDFLKIRERASQLLHAWVLGFATMLATAQLVLVPFVMMQFGSWAMPFWLTLPASLVLGALFLGAAYGLWRALRGYVRAVSRGKSTLDAVKAG